MAKIIPGFLLRYSKRCPVCRNKQGRLSSDNSTPLNHRCFDCGWKGIDTQVLRPPVGGWGDLDAL